MKLGFKTGGGFCNYRGSENVSQMQMLLHLWKYVILLKEALSILMLCAPVFIFTSGSSALLRRPRCGLLIWPLLLAIFNALCWVYVHFLHEKTDKPRKYSKSTIFLWYKNVCQWLLATQSINTVRASLNTACDFLAGKTVVPDGYFPRLLASTYIPVLVYIILLSEDQHSKLAFVSECWMLWIIKSS